MRREHHNGSRTGAAGARSALTRLLVAAAGGSNQTRPPICEAEYRSAEPTAGLHETRSTRKQRGQGRRVDRHEDMDMTGKMSEIDMQGGSGHEDARSQRKATGTRCSAWVRRLAASLFVFAALGTALPAAAQTDVWTATITPADLGFDILGCSNSTERKCSNTSYLSDDSFTHDSTDYAVITFFLRASGSFEIELDTNITTATNALTLVVDTTSLVLANADTSSDTTREWDSSGISFTAGTAVTVKLTSGTSNTAPTVANPIPDQAATVGTAFSYQFPLNTFNDVDATDTLTYTATKADGNDLPTWLGFTAATRTFEGTAQAADVETLAVKLTASDGTASVSDEFNIGVRAATACSAPDLAGRTQIWTNTVNVGSSTSGNVTLHGWYSSLVPPLGSLSNPANRAFGTNYLSRSYSVVGAYTHVVDMGNTSLDLFLNEDLTSGESAKLSLHVCDETFTLGNAAHDPTTHRYRWANVTLDWSSESTRTLYMSVPTNTAPTVANAIPDQAATVGTAFSYQFPLNTFHDADTGSTLTYTATKPDDAMLPTWLGFTASTRTFSGSPQAADVETLAVKVTASDGTASVSDEFNIGVSAAGDTTAPTLSSATVEGFGKSIDLVFSEAYTVPSDENDAIQFFNTLAGALSVTANSATVGFDMRASSQEYSQGRMTLGGLSPTIGQGQTVVITYTDPTAGDDAVAIEDAAGNETATFTTGVNSVPDVVNNSTAVAGDTTAPTLSSAFVHGSGRNIQFRFSENIQRSNLAPVTAFTVTADGSPVTLSSVNPGITVGRVVINVATTITQGQSVVVTYTDPTTNDDTNAIQDAAGNDVATFTTGEDSVPGVRNNSTAVAGDTTAPTLISAVVNESGLFVQLQFSENVDRSNVPPDTAVRVTCVFRSKVITESGRK